MINFIYSEKYLNYSFGKTHPFWPERANEFIELFKSKSDFKFQVVDAPRATDEDILLVHTQDYLEMVKEAARKGGRLSIDTPVTKDNLEAAYYYTGGTIKSAELALEGKKVVNLLGGLHHAESSSSSGFCIFNDHGIAIRKMQKEKRLKKVAVLDLDVHAGNGTQEIFCDDSSVLTISIHQDPSTIYPGTGFEHQTGEGDGKGFNINKVLAPGTEGEEYLEVLDSVLPEIEDFAPDLVFVILGVDTYKNDPLASIKLDKKTYGEIAKRIRGLENKAVLFAGGYSKSVPELWLEFVSSL